MEPVLALIKVEEATPIEVLVPALGVRTVPKFWKSNTLLMADPFARLTIPVLLKLPPPKSVVPLAKNVPLFRNPEPGELDKPVKLVVPFAVNVPELAKLDKPLMLVVPLAANTPAFERWTPH